MDGALAGEFHINNPSGSPAIDRNTITNMRMGPDSHIGTAIIAGQNQGISAITISNNSLSNNSPGIYPIATDAKQTGVAVSTGTITAGVISYTPVNTIDPIEIGLCRGTARMTVTATGNVISLPISSSGAMKQDGDGIDFNIGSNSILNANVINNTVLTLGGTGDNGITFDIRGNAQAQIGITKVTLSGNTFSNADALLNIDLINNPGVPVFSFYVTGLGSNASPVGATVPNDSDFNTGRFTDLYRHSSLYIKP